MWCYNMFSVGGRKWRDYFHTSVGIPTLRAAAGQSVQVESLGLRRQSFVIQKSSLSCSLFFFRESSSSCACVNLVRWNVSMASSS